MFINMRYCPSCKRRRSASQFRTATSETCRLCEGISETVSEDTAVKVKGSSARPKSSAIDKTSKL